MNNLPVSSHQLKIFFASFVITFFVVSLQLIGVRISFPGLISPVHMAKEDALAPLLPHLEQKENTFSLKKSGGFIATAQAASEADQANAYVVVDFDSGSIIAEHNADSEVSIASITKVMTAVVALDLASPDERFTVTEKAAAQIPTKIGVVAGQQMTVKELLYAALLTSANDAVEVIRDGIDNKYGEGVFMRAMNHKAEFLGLKKTQFENPQGFDASTHHSSAEDVAILTHYALSNYPLIAEMVKLDYMKLEANEYHKQFDLNNWNGLIGVYPNVSGVKIGNTDAAMKTTAVTAERGGKRLIVILLGAPGIIERDLWAAQLLDQGFEDIAGLQPINVTEAQLREKYASWNYWN